MDLRGLNRSARKAYGADIAIMVARAAAWGHEDNLILVSGRNHASAAADIARAVASQGFKPVITEERTAGFLGSTDRVSSKIQFAAR